MRRANTSKFAAAAVVATSIVLSVAVGLTDSVRACLDWGVCNVFSRGRT